MAKLLRQQPADLFVIGLRDVQNAVDDINADQQPEWTTSLRDSLNEFTGIIIKEHGGPPPTRECDFEMNHLRSEHTVCHGQNSERFKYNYKIYSQKVGFVRLNLRTVPRFYLYARKTVPCVCAWTIGNSTTLRGKTVHRYPGLMNYSTRYMGLITAIRWTCIRAITKFELGSAAYIRQHSELITDCSSTAFYPLDYATPQLDSKR
jgi:hypothetical protein